MAVKIQLHVITTLFSFIFFGSPFTVNVHGYDNQAPHDDHIDDVAVNCGYHGNSTALDGRQWFGDEGGTNSFISRLQPRGESTSSTADHRSLSADPIPYMSARVSSTQFYYTFQLNPGQKFVRLHFHPSFYPGFEKSRDFFTVKAGPFTLLKNFSASITAEALGVKYLVKEYCLNVEKEKHFNLTFSPSQNTKQRNIYAFVNGIEIISMPTSLYYTPDGDLGARVVGQSNRYIIDNSTALEMVQRLNIGGSSISPVEDFVLFRRWNEDANYLLESQLERVNQLVHGVKYSGKTIFIAPLKIYHRSWRPIKYGTKEKLHNFTWKIQVDLGFGYLVRLHFCDFGPKMTESFNILINNQIAESKADVISLSGGIGVPIHRDYVVFLKGQKEEAKIELFVALQSSDESIVGLLHGVEIFKLSSLDNNLASPNPVSMRQAQTSSDLKIQNLLLAFGKSNAIGTGMTILIILLSIIVFKLKQKLEKTGHKEKDTQSASSKQSLRRFSLAEIISATQNFSDELFIGKGGFGNVYKGFIHEGSEVVAVKRLKSNSKQGAPEFWTEIETLSKVRHIHLVSLIGYCNECQEMILVYEYMPCGTLADNLYKNLRKGKDVIPLTWDQRLRICIGVARGLDYLHSGIEYGVIHRDVKDSNILLDGNLVAKVSDFGLSKLGNISESQGDISTKPKGTFGYLDDHCIMTHNQTKKTDVYAFGVVMLVVLCGRPAVDRRIPGEQQILLSSFQIRGIDDIIDPSLRGKVSSESLKEFLTCIENCLNYEPKKRPTMAHIVASLENALERQQTVPSFILAQASSVGQSDKVEYMEMSYIMKSPIFSESVTGISPLEEEGIETQANQTVEVKTKGEVFQSREKDTCIQKPLWGWPWEALSKRGKAMKKKDLFPIHNGHQFSIADIQAATDDFNADNQILKDEFMMVYKGFIKTRNVIVYRFKRKIHDEEEVLELGGEVEKLSQIGHENLAVWIGYCYHLNEVFIVYQYMANGILHNYLYDDKCVPLTWHQRLQICLGVAQGLNYLHNGTDKRIVHYDLKPKNILLGGNLTPCISNSGLCTVSPIGHLPKAATTKHPSFREHLPPEVIVGLSTLTEKPDVYSFGLVLLEVVCSRRPTKFGRYDHERCLKKWVKRGIKRRTLHEFIDSKAKMQIAERCLAEILKITLSCLADQSIEMPSMSHVVEGLQVAIRLQDNAESANEEMNKDFNFELIYQEMSNLEEILKVTAYHSVHEFPE